MTTPGSAAPVGPFQQFLPNFTLATAQGTQAIPAQNNVVPPVQPAPIYRPTKPTMGGIIQASTTEHVAWTGGLPLVDWSGLDPTAPTVNQSPNQYRPSQVAASQKGYNFRTMGISPLFQRAPILSPFKMISGMQWLIEALIPLLMYQI